MAAESIDICYPNVGAPVSVLDVKTLVALGAVGLLVAGCGTRGCQMCTAPSTATRFDVTATEKDHAVSMRVGQKLEVVLHGGDMTSWQRLESSDPSILEATVDPAATAVRGVTLGAFKAIASGKANVSAIGSPVCPSGQACPAYAILYSLAVTVTP